MQQPQLMTVMNHTTPNDIANTVNNSQSNNNNIIVSNNNVNRVNINNAVLQNKHIGVINTTTATSNIQSNSGGVITGNLLSATAPDAKAKQVLKEAVDAVVNSFAKHTQGYGRGKNFFLF